MSFEFRDISTMLFARLNKILTEFKERKQAGLKSIKGKNCPGKIVNNIHS